MRLQAPHCPNCGAVISFAPGTVHVACSYCRVTLHVERERVTSPARAPTAGDEKREPAFAPPEASLVTSGTDRFELSVLEQKIAGTAPQLWSGLDLGENAFALVGLRITNESGRPVPGPLEKLLETLRASLEADRDPGLAANLALEAAPASARLEIGILLFDARRMSVTTYQAGCPEACWWLSHEEGRAITLDSHRPPLERRMLREARDHFSNAEPKHLAAGDLVIWLSPGVLGRGEDTSYPLGIRPLIDELNAQLGEEPLKVVTLVKNRLWEAREASPWLRAKAPVGDVVVAAVRALPPELAGAIPGSGKLELHRTPHFELALRRTPGDAAALLPLHNQRSVLVWLGPGEGGPLASGALETATRAVLAVLDRPDHGDNENPRRAGREALAALGRPAELAVIQLIDVHGAVKFFCSGWGAPVLLDDRGDRSTLQPYDGGGDSWLRGGARLLFPGSLPLAGPAPDPARLAPLWPGGKASRLYGAARDHWKTKSSERALDLLGRAAVSDVRVEALSGLALVTHLE